MNKSPKYIGNGNYIYNNLTNGHSLTIHLFNTNTYLKCEVFFLKSMDITLSGNFILQLNKFCLIHGAHFQLRLMSHVLGFNVA